MNDLREAAAFLAAALNDTETSAIGDPRKKGYRVVFTRSDVRDAFELGRRLTILGCNPSTVVKHHPDTGEPMQARVVLYTVDDQRRVLNATSGRLDPDRIERLDRLVRARGPIPIEILEKIKKSIKAGRKPDQIAKRLNELEVIDGMGGVSWTGRKVTKAVTTNRKAQERKAA
jgi:hypothetical protein